MHHKKKSAPKKSYRSVVVVITVLLMAGLGLAASLWMSNKPKAQNGSYELRGVVESVDKTKNRATINHEKVGDLMDAMTMSFVIKDEKALSEMRSGDQIIATMVSTDTGYWLEQITIIVKTT